MDKEQGTSNLPVLAWEYLNFLKEEIFLHVKLKEKAQEQTAIQKVPISVILF